ISYDKVANVLVVQGKLDEALKAYRDGLAIRERLSAADPSNTQWQRDLAASYSEIAEVMVKEGNAEEALVNYREALTILERLAAADPSNLEWQVDIIEINRELAMHGDDPGRRFAFIVAGLRRLQTVTKLTDEQKVWLSEAETQLAKLTQ